jgi:hypothetical protein
MPMTEDERTTLPPVLAYARLLRRSHNLIAAGKGDSEEAEMLADDMDAPWYAMNECEQDRMRGLSADLYALREGGPKRIEMSDQEVAKWKKATKRAYAGLHSGEIDATLAFLRRPIPHSLPGYVTPFLQAKCWEKLGDLETALVFVKEAERQMEVYWFGAA